MSDEQIVSEVVVSEAQKVRGPRGVVGKATAGLTIKQLWKADGDSRGSLREFARALRKGGNAVASAWFDHKKGSLNAKRTPANEVAARAAAAATHTERRKPKKGNKAAA
jgi:hypothetical protein